MKFSFVVPVAAGSLAALFVCTDALNTVHAAKPKFIMAGMSGSENWAGYVDTANGQPYTDITGSWTVPSITGSDQSANAQWIGLGGVQSTDLLQMGTLETIQNGQQVDELFWENLPKTAVPIVQVQAGDTVSTEIKHLYGNKWQLTARISNGRENFTKTVGVTETPSYSGQIEQTAEWISEDPENGQQQIVPLANAGSVTFNNATVNSGPISQPNSDTQATILIDSADGVTVIPTKLTDNGTSFTTVPGSQANIPLNIQVIPGQNGLPGGLFPSTDLAQMWQQMIQMEQQMNQMFQLPQSNSGSSQSTPWVQQLSTVANTHPNTQTWSGTSGGWHWSIQIIKN